MNNEKVIFIVGNSRSGTTMLGRVFGRHSQVHTFGELHFFEQQVSSADIKSNASWSNDKLILLLERLLTSSRDGLFCSVEKGKYRDDAEIILNACDFKTPVAIYANFLKHEAMRNKKVIPCEQTPRYLFSADDILSVFPAARIINLVRDPRDVLLSQKNKWRRRFLGAKNIPLKEAFRAWVNYHPYTMAKLWVSTVRKAQALEGDTRFVSLRFEDLLKQPEKEIRILCEHTGVEFEKRMLEVPQVGSSTGVDRPDQKGIDSSRSLGWRKGGLSSLELAICQDVAVKEMKALGYAVEPISVVFWLKWLSMLGFVFKISLSLLLNIRRSKNIIGSIRRRLIQG